MSVILLTLEQCTLYPDIVAATTWLLRDDGYNKDVFNDDADDAVQAILGHGIDNHLLGLRQIAEQCGNKTPELFLDDAYKTSNHFTLSTSQVKLGRLQTIQYIKKYL